MNLSVLLLSFWGVNFDFFFILLFLLKRYHISQVILGYLSGVMILLVMSYIISQSLATFIPEWLLGVLGILPIYMAIHDNDEKSEQKKQSSAIITVLITYLSVCSGCVLAIFLPVMFGQTMQNLLAIILITGCLTVLVVFLVRLVSDSKLVTGLMNRYGEMLMKCCYTLVGLYIFWDSGLINHLMSYF